MNRYIQEANQQFISAYNRYPNHIGSWRRDVSL